MTTEKVEITEEHLAIIRKKYDCNGMEDEEIIKAMLRYERGILGGKWVLEMICFPDFQAYLNHYRK